MNITDFTYYMSTFELRNNVRTDVWKTTAILPNSPFPAMFL